jgi:hypothetical protein
LKPSRLVTIFTFTALLSAVFLSNVWANNNAGPQEGGHGNKHGFGVRQYDHFHDILHPLEHEALPQKDFQRIRAKSAQLAQHGRAIVRLGVPRGTSKANRPEFVKELRKFSTALTKFRSDARRGTDEQLKTSYSAVHDSFEMLAAMLPRG